MTAAWQPADVPAADEVTEPWWAATRDHRLVLQACGACEAVQHPPRAVCTSCGNTRSWRWPAAAGLGIVDSFTVVHRPPQQDLGTPYVVARVRLAEGVVLLTRLEERSPNAWVIGDQVQTSWVDLPDGRAMPVFVPAPVQSDQ